MQKTRILFLFIIFAAAWSALVIRAAQLQILPDQKLAELQKRQFRGVVELPSRRGIITDRSGKELAVSVPAYSLFVDPKLVRSPRTIAREVSAYLGLSHKELARKLRDKNRRFHWIKRQLTKEQWDHIAGRNWQGVGFVEESKRVYPNGELLSQVIGFLGSEGKGLEGLERHYDSYLRGEKKVLKLERDARGRPLLHDGQVFSEMPAGADLELTIDSEVQFVLEKALRETKETLLADGALGIVLDVATNEVLAMAQVPSFDPNNAFASSNESWRNRVISDVFEPGSVVKSFVVAGALDLGIYRPNSTIDCENGRMKIGNRIIREADEKHSFGVLTINEVLAKSSNVGTSKMALKIGDKKVRDILSAFGLSSRSGLDTAGEAKGIFANLPWKDHLLANISFGHGIATTPLQIANAYAAIANGGELRTPILVKAIRNPESGEEAFFESKVLGRAISKETAATMRLMLTDVTSNEGTGSLARVAGFPVAGKTGTAQKVNKAGGYSQGEYISSFAGMIPSNDPKYVIYVAIDNPREKYYGSEVAAPLFSRVAGYMVRRSGLAPILISENNVHKPKVNKEREAIARIRQMADAMKSEEENSVPDLTGLSLRDALNKIRGSDLKLQVRGKGTVSSTVPAAGETLPGSRTVRVILE